MTLAMGLVGVSMVLKTLLDGLFNEWDAVADAKYLMRNGLRLKHHSSIRAEDLMLDEEKARASAPGLTTRVYEQKRHELEEIFAVEDRVSHAPHEPASLT